MMFVDQIRRRWPIFAAVGSSIVSAVMAGAVSIIVSQRSIDSERRAREAAADERVRAAAATQAIVCKIVTTQEEVFQEATGEVGRKAADAWHDLGILFRCVKE